MCPINFTVDVSCVNNPKMVFVSHTSTLSQSLSESVKSFCEVLGSSIEHMVPSCLGQTPGLGPTGG